jgi:hypothetical protein
MKKYLIIKADTNDGDYVTEKSEVSDAEIEKIKPIIEVIAACTEDHNFPDGECSDPDELENLYLESGLLTEQQLDFIKPYIPYGEYGVHTIESVEILVVSEEITLL